MHRVRKKAIDGQKSIEMMTKKTKLKEQIKRGVLCSKNEENHYDCCEKILSIFFFLLLFSQINYLLLRIITTDILYDYLYLYLYIFYNNSQKSAGCHSCVLLN